IFVIYTLCLHDALPISELSNAADQHFTMQMAAGFTYKHVPGSLTFYRDVPGSMSKNIQRYQDDHLRLFRKAREAGYLRPAMFRRSEEHTSELQSRENLV